MSCRVKGIVWKEGRACQLDRDQIKQQGVYYSPVDDARIEAQTCHNPDHCENGKDGIAELLIVGILGELGGLQEDVGTVVNNENQGANAMQIAHPAERHQQQGDHVMDEHLPEVLTFHIEELGASEGPVEGHRNHVVPPDIIADRLQEC